MLLLLLLLLESADGLLGRKEDGSAGRRREPYWFGGMCEDEVDDAIAKDLVDGVNCEERVSVCGGLKGVSDKEEKEAVNE